MKVHLGGEFQLGSGDGNLAAKASNSSNSLVVDKIQGTPTTLKEYRWSFIPMFSLNYEWRGLAIRSALNGEFIRGNPDMPNGGGVSLVSEADVDEWAGWYPGTHVGATRPFYVPLILAPKSSAAEICVMTLYGGGGWGPGTQVITYRWEGADNQLWAPLFQDG